MNSLRKRNGSGRISYEALDDSEYDDEPETRESEPLISHQRAPSSYSSHPSSSTMTISNQSTGSAISALLGGSLQNFLKLFNMLLEFVFHPFSASSRLPPFELSGADQEALNSFKEKAHLAYDTSSKSHEEVLVRLWRLSFPDDPHGHAPVSKKWKKLGFQNDNPASDFRGVGIFGLQNLIYYGEKYPSRFNKSVGERRAEEFDLNQYPFAITGLNITMLLFELLGWGLKARILDQDSKEGPYPSFRRSFIKLLLSQPIPSSSSSSSSTTSLSSLSSLSAPSPSPQADLISFDDFSPSTPLREQATEQPSSSSPTTFSSPSSSYSYEALFKEEIRIFEEVYCTAFMLLDDEWTRVRASYFQFPLVLQTVREKLQVLLLSFHSLADVLRHNQREATKFR